MTPGAGEGARERTCSIACEPAEGYHTPRCLMERKERACEDMNAAYAEAIRLWREAKTRTEHLEAKLDDQERSWKAQVTAAHARGRAEGAKEHEVAVYCAGMILATRDPWSVRPDVVELLAKWFDKERARGRAEGVEAAAKIVETYSTRTDLAERIRTLVEAGDGQEM